MRFEGLNLLLADELFFERCCSGSGAAGFLDLPVEVLNLALQAELEVVGPAVELFGLGLEEAGVALGDVALDGFLALEGEGFELCGVVGGGGPTPTLALPLRGRE